MSQVCISFIFMSHFITSFAFFTPEGPNWVYKCYINEWGARNVLVLLLTEHRYFQKDGMHLCRTNLYLVYDFKVWTLLYSLLIWKPNLNFFDIHLLKLYLALCPHVHLPNSISCLFIHPFPHSAAHLFRYCDQGCEERWRICDQWRKDVDHQWYSGWLDVSPRQHQRRPSAQEQISYLFAHEPSWYQFIIEIVWHKSQQSRGVSWPKKQTSNLQLQFFKWFIPFCPQTFHSYYQ